MSLEVDMSLFDIFKMSCQFIRHKIEQYSRSTSKTTIINTQFGQVRGRQRITLHNDQELYFAFEGIPFAKPPLGDLRFRAPQPPECWEGVRDCTYPRSKPTQMYCMLNIAHGSEDCLHLNVYTKKLSSEKPLPVMVWIYSGGFQVGEASKDMHGPDYFMQKDIVLVTFNHRLGALGFLSLSDPDLNVPGNAGLKDQVMALRWIHKNITNFNGDSNNITLMGMSSGAASVQIMMTTEQTRGLFHKAILMSGSSLCHWANDMKYNWPYRLACYLGYIGSNNDKDVLHFLQGASSTQLARCNAILSQEDKRDYLLFPFVPTVEPYITEGCVISEPNVNTLSKAWGNEIPVIIGSTSFEGLFSYQYVKRDYTHFLSDFKTMIPREIRETCNLEQLEDHIKQLKLHSFKDASRDCMEFNECLVLLSMKHFRHAVHRTALARLAYAPRMPTYLYRFDFDSPTFNFFRLLLCGPDQRGAAHADDFFYMFYGVPAFKVNNTSPEYQTIEHIINMWTTFATHGNPNYAQAAPITWEPLKPDVPQMCLNIGRRLQFIELPEAKELKLWDSFYDNINLF
ncbi:esterase B1-like [Drosophila sulfurigaster albostrigata]|uniref:esterase B1-like n=1 Tax=Drosophila sulfurigaster albostrigata TaxID=89887 RepID=UPI002D21CA09|nr:esterase B1-like [Drosophila sulfurigaster albostrigata]